jgi:hypothetical protein
MEYRQSDNVYLWDANHWNGACEMRNGEWKFSQPDICSGGLGPCHSTCPALS